MTNLCNRLVRDRKGATAIEYGLIAALIALALTVGAGALGKSLNTKFNDASTAVDNAGVAK